MDHQKILLVRDRSAFSTKWVCNFASQLCEMDYDVTLLCDEHKQKKEVPIHSQVHKINLSRNVWGLLVPQFLRFSRAIKKIKPDVIICYFLKDLFNVAFCQNHNVPIIMMMHNPPNEVFEKQFKNPIKKWIFHHLMKKVSVIQVLMPEFVDMIKAEFPDKKVVVIPNQVIIPKENKEPNNVCKTIIHVAQIAKAKRQKDLIEVFIPLAKEFSDWKIKFFGKVKKSSRHQKYRTELQQLVHQNHLEKQILFPGFSNNITEEYLNSDIVVLPSYTEGFGYGLADGLALGLPGIGYDFALAINRILINGKSGFLVKDKNDFTDKLKILMSDKELRNKMGHFARKDMEKYSPEVVMKKWDNLIQSVLEKK